MNNRKIGSRLNRELEKLKNPSPGISCFIKEEDVYTLEAQIIGPQDTPYENGVFVVEIIVPENYPFIPPVMKFVTKIYHPNIDSAGRICLDLLKMPPNGAWRPTVTIEFLLVALRDLMRYPNAEDPVMPSIGEEYKFHNEIYNQEAKRYTEKYAMQILSTEKAKDGKEDICSTRKRKIPDEEKNEPSTSKKATP